MITSCRRRGVWPPTGECIYVLLGCLRRWCVFLFLRKKLVNLLKNITKKKSWNLISSVDGGGEVFLEMERVLRPPPGGVGAAGACLLVIPRDE